MDTQEPPHLLDSKQLAEMLGVPPRTLDQWAWRGVGPRFLKVGRHRRYRRSDVDQWINSLDHRGGDAS